MNFEEMEIKPTKSIEHVTDMVM
jgi:hypothetical protein